MKIYIDENFPRPLAEGLNVLEIPNNDGFEVIALIDEFGVGAKDQDWIPLVGDEGGVVITQDLRIQRTRQLKELYMQHGLGIFFFKSPSKTGYSYWEMVEQAIKRWKELKDLAKNTPHPFAYRCTSRSSKFEKI